MELVMRWRIAPSTANRLAIPEPFRPTPLQSMNCDHSLMIDFVNWPTLRDQLILYGTCIDLDVVVRDIVTNTVIDIPQMQVALNILDLFQNKVLANIGTDSFVTGGRCDISLIATASAEDLSARIFQEVTARMAYADSLQRTFEGVHSPVRGPRELKHALSTRLGLSKLNEWKLSQEFCQKYPMFDCSSGEPKILQYTVNSLLT